MAENYDLFDDLGPANNNNDFTNFQQSNSGGMGDGMENMDSGYDNNNQPQMNEVLVLLT